MRKKSAALLFFFFLLNVSFAQQVIKLAELEKILGSRNDTTYVVNFWATWCMPCVREMPELEKINTTFADKKVKVVLISLDFKRELETRLIPFIEKNKIKSTVFLLNEPDYDSWIDKVEKTWGGAIPVTLIYSKRGKVFLEKEVTYSELEKNINQLIN